MAFIPDGGHVKIHPLKLLLRRIEGVRGRVKLVGFKTLVREPDLERLIILLQCPLGQSTIRDEQPLWFRGCLLLEHRLSRRERRQHRW